MSEVLVKRAIDRSKYPNALIYVDRQGNVCKADKRQPLSPEEKAKRQEARNKKYAEHIEAKRKLREVLHKAKKEAKKNPLVGNAEAYEKAKEDYEDFKLHGFKTD